MTLRTLFFTLMLFTCAFLMALGLSIQSTEMATIATQQAELRGPTERAVYATLFAQATDIIGTATQRAIAATPLPFSVQTSRAIEQPTIFALATKIIRGATQTVQAEATLTGTP